MNSNLKLVIGLYVLTFVTVVAMIAFLVVMYDQTENYPEPIEKILNKMTSILELFIGAVVGALSTAMAFVFRERESE